MVCCRKCSISAFCILAGLLLCVGGAAFTTGLDSIPTATRQRMRRRGPSDYHPLHALESVEEPTVTQTSSQSKAVNARSVAAHALLEKKGQPSLQRLESDPLFKSLEDQRNRSFARLLVTTVERRLGQIDAVLKQCQSSNHKSKKKKQRIRRDDLYVQACLRIGAAQLLFLDVPAYAAVQETIECLRQDRNRYEM